MVAFFLPARTNLSMGRYGTIEIRFAELAGAS